MSHSPIDEILCGGIESLISGGHTLEFDTNKAKQLIAEYRRLVVEILTPLIQREVAKQILQDANLSLINREGKTYGYHCDNFINSLSQRVRRYDDEMKNKIDVAKLVIEEGKNDDVTT